MPDAQTVVVNSIRTLLERRDADVEVSLESNLYEELELDSLEVAELSAILEDDLGSDPYSEGIVPQTVAEVIAFYAS